MPFVYCESIADSQTGTLAVFECADILRSRYWEPIFTKAQALIVVDAFRQRGFKAQYDEARDAFVFAYEPTIPATYTHAEYPADYDTTWPDDDREDTLFKSGWNARDYQIGSRPGLYMIGGGNWVIWAPVDDTDTPTTYVSLRVTYKAIKDRLKDDVLDALATRARQAMFTPIAELLPEMQHREFLPLHFTPLHEMIKRAIRSWALHNLPEGTDASSSMCEVCEQRDDTVLPNIATVLLHGMKACQECVEWHQSDPHHCEDYTSEHRFAHCLTPPITK
jgi:hypothetical protein